MKKSISLVIVVIGLTLLSLLGTYVLYITNTSMVSAVDVFQSDSAFYIAEGGLHYVLKKDFYGVIPLEDYSLADDSSYGAVPFGNGTFSVDYVHDTDDPQNKITIIVTGSVTRGNNTYERTIDLSLHKTAGSPDITDHILYTSGDVTIDNNHNVTYDIYGEITGETVIIDGEVTEEGDPESPSFNFDYYKQRIQALDNGANIRYITGDITIQDDRGVDIPGQGILYYVEGNVELKKGVTIYGTIITDGNIEGWNGSLIWITVPFDIDGDSEYETMPAMAAKGNIEFWNVHPLIIHGLVFAQGSVRIWNVDDEFELEGAIVACGNIDIKNIKIDFTLDFSDAQLPPGVVVPEGTTEGIVVLNWKEI